jgi:hypothetical protein
MTQTIYWTLDIRTDSSRCCGNHNNREEGKIFWYTGNVSHLQNYWGKSSYERHIHWYTQPHIRSITRNVQKITVHNPLPFSSSPPRYTINAGVGTLYIYNVHTRGKTATLYAGAVKDIQAEGQSESINVSKRNITLKTLNQNNNNNVVSYILQT